MSVNEDPTNIRINSSKIKSPIYFSPYAHKKKVIGNLYTEPRKIPISTDSPSKNKTKSKISNPTVSKNIINIQPQECFRKSQKFLSEMNNDKSHQNKRNMPQSYKKINSKLYLKKNVIPNLSTFNEVNSNAYATQLGTNSNTNTKVDINNSVNTKLYKSRVANMKFNMPKNNSNNYISMKESFHNLKKSAGSATELFGNNYIKKTKTKARTCSELNNINSIGYILTSTATSNNKNNNINNNNNNNKLFLSPRNTPGQKIIFLKNEKNKLKDKYFSQNINKDNLKVIQTQANEPINNIEDKNKSTGIQYLLRNTYNDVKIFPTTFLNNKIIYQTENNINNTNSTSNRNNDIKNENLNKKDKQSVNISISIDEKNNIANYEKSQSIEEVHYLYVSTIQNGKKLILKWDKCNS